jgi:drug/metabolite transporter (DMT)-like permease
MAVMWGVSWPAGKTLALSITPYAGAAWRFTFAVAVLALWQQRVRAGWPRLTARQWLGLTAAGVVGVAGYSIVFMLALREVEASRAAVVVTTNPVFTTVLAAWLFKERFNARIALGLLCAVLGAAIVLTQGRPWLLLVGGVGYGEWLLLACVATWVAYTLIGRALLAGIDALTATTVGAAIGLVVLWAAALAVEGPALAWQGMATLSAAGWASMLFLAVGATVLSYAWFNRGIATLGAGTAASYISLVPVIGVASSAALLGEHVGPSLLVGGALALVGVVAANRARA